MFVGQLWLKKRNIKSKNICETSVADCISIKKKRNSMEYHQTRRLEAVAGILSVSFNF